MTIAQALRAFPVEVESDLLLAHVLKQPKEVLFREPRQEITTSQAIRFKKLGEKRAAGIPIAYLIGYKYFFGRKFLVNKKVLIPHPETEWLIERVVKLRQSSKTLSVLDVGTGTGCIAISIAKELPQSTVTACDISDQVLKIAQRNAKIHQVNIKFIQSDLLSKVAGKFDVIVANLPYVPITEYWELHWYLKHEPRLALTDGTDKFITITNLIKAAKSKLKPGAVLLLEIDPASKNIVRKSLAKYFPKKQIKFYKDIRGLIRYVEII